MNISLSNLKQKLNTRVVVSVLAAVLVVGGGIVAVNILNKPTLPTVAKKHGPGRFAGIDAQVNQKIDAQQIFLEMYKVNNQHYPAEASPDVFANQPGISGDIGYVFQAPPGFKFAYEALPKGCTTAASNCTDYKLVATDIKGKIVYKVSTVKTATASANTNTSR